MSNNFIFILTSSKLAMIFLEKVAAILKRAEI